MIQTITESEKPKTDVPQVLLATWQPEGRDKGIQVLFHQPNCGTVISAPSNAASYRVGHYSTGLASFNAGNWDCSPIGTKIEFVVNDWKLPTVAYNGKLSIAVLFFTVERGMVLITPDNEKWTVGKTYDGLELLNQAEWTILSAASLKTTCENF